MDSLKYCLVWAAALCYVVVAANTEGEKVIGTFSKTTARGPLVQGTVSVLWDGSLKIKDYKMPEQDVDSCRFFFYIGSKEKGTVHDDFLDGEQLISAQQDQTEFIIELEQNNINEIEATDVAWLVVGCNYEGNADKIAYLKFPENDWELPKTTTTPKPTTTLKPTTTTTATTTTTTTTTTIKTETEKPEVKGSAPGQVGLWTPLMLFSFYLAQTRLGLF